MSLDEREFSEAVERAERALAEGDLKVWREALELLAFEGSEEQWARFLELRAARQRAGRERGRPDGSAEGRA